LQKALAWLHQNEQITPTADDYLQAAVIKAAARKQGAIVELPDCVICRCSYPARLAAGDREHE
jgi:predicted nucleic acid-binding protein